MTTLSHFIFLFNSFFQNVLAFDEEGWDLTVIASHEPQVAKGFIEQKFAAFIAEKNLVANLKTFSAIKDVRITPNLNVYKIDGKISVNNLILEFLVDNTWIPWSYLSDGTKRLFYVIAEMSSEEDGLVLVEEPELGIHPHQLYKLMQFIKEQSALKQIIVSTHSPIVLDALKSNELDRVIIAKSINGNSHFSKLTDEQITYAKQYMEEVAELSYYWLHSDLEDND